MSYHNQNFKHLIFTSDTKKRAQNYLVCKDIELIS